MLDIAQVKDTVFKTADVCGKQDKVGWTSLENG